MANPGVSGAHHDAVVEQIAQSRYPFPDQTDWPESYDTVTNAPVRQRSVMTDAGEAYPDIVIVDRTTDEVVELGEVEVEVSEEDVEKWRAYAALTKVHATTGAPHFFIYVPDGLATETLRLLQTHDVPYGGLRTWEVTDTGLVRIVPIVTPVDAKDHR
jgi:hypothetical protein